MASDDFLPLRGYDHVEFYVGNAKQAAYFYRAAMGMSLVAYRGPETGTRDRASYVVQQGKILYVGRTGTLPSTVRPGARSGCGRAARSGSCADRSGGPHPR